MNLAGRLMGYGAIAGVVITWAIPAYGQWMEQTIDLRIGWNSVFVEVDPSPESSDLLFGDHPAVVLRPDRCIFGVVDESWNLDRLMIELASKLSMHE